LRHRTGENRSEILQRSACAIEIGIDRFEFDVAQKRFNDRIRTRSGFGGTRIASG